MRLLGAVTAWTVVVLFVACPDAVAAKKSRKARKAKAPKAAEEKKTAGPDAKLSKEELGQLFMKEMDKDKDGYLSKKEFMALSEGPLADKEGFNVDLAFARVDKNRDGVVDADEAAEFYKMAAELPDDEAEAEAKVAKHAAEL
ncbi:unnamed protein product [Prorocentrum cordatum]|uniref:EF-hand domain-containing protein n=1 Tax=Prorocentrum cordatum TaxID=2364126 RepID=A0ABN9UG29_9DINO|nr:unnamed protein product [Polarella glacialis]|mmetsp:Transcript_85542/g.223166  ORF Transcript_85542/g.223166 Transcript_85542/m.223166 type:complete len:143 (-) Transcript_85542:234-662(-)